MRNYFTFGTVDSRDYGVYISGESVFNAPSREYEAISIPGRNGDLLLGGDRFQNIDVTYPAFICSNFKTNIANFRNALAAQKGYKQLIDTYHPDEVRYGCFMNEIEVKPTASLDAGEFEITFNCKPQRFLASGLVPVEFTSKSKTFTNPTNYDSMPIIKITGYGTFYEYLPDETRLKWIVANIYDDVTFDSELWDVYHGTANANEAVTFETVDTPFPVFKPGANRVQIHSQANITKITVTPRWFTI